MPSDCPRAAHPLNQQAVAEADRGLYAAHAKDSRPNALFDAVGKKKPLHPSDPSQEFLRAEWTQFYGNAGGKFDTSKPAIGSPPGTAILNCPRTKAKLSVEVVYNPLTAPIKNVEVTIKGPLTQTITTDATGIAKFVDLPPGVYNITAHYVGIHKLVVKAQPLVGRGDWDCAARSDAPRSFATAT